uniref:Plasminogen receptor, C-terminal lysine transmembrane protein n=1 Tax=Xiphophorus couchianus TaxID=32473 RepID=A0A3B5LF91_9TELE
MGFLMSKSMDANLQKQQEFMLNNSRLQMERQIQMQNQMRERQMAMQIAWSREFLKYFGSFFTVATLGLTAGAIKRKNPGMLAPIIPLGFIFAYQMDSAYGTLIYRMRGEARLRISWRLSTIVWTCLWGRQLVTRIKIQTVRPVRSPVLFLFYHREQLSGPIWVP